MPGPLIADLRTGMYPVACAQIDVCSGEVANIAYLNAASCFSLGADARMPRPAPPVGQPNATGPFGRNAVPTGNLAAASWPGSPPVEAIIADAMPPRKSLSAFCGATAQPSTTDFRSHSPASTAGFSAIFTVKSGSEYEPPQPQTALWNDHSM